MIIKYTNKEDYEDEFLDLDREYLVLGLGYNSDVKFGLSYLILNNDDQIIGISPTDCIVLDKTPSKYWKIFNLIEGSVFIGLQSWSYDIEEVLYSISTNPETIYDDVTRQKEFTRSINDISSEFGFIYPNEKE